MYSLWRKSSSENNPWLWNILPLLLDSGHLLSFCVLLVFFASLVITKSPAVAILSQESPVPLALLMAGWKAEMTLPEGPVPSLLT